MFSHISNEIWAFVLNGACMLRFWIKLKDVSLLVFLGFEMVFCQMIVSTTKIINLGFGYLEMQSVIYCVVGFGIVQ